MNRSKIGAWLLLALLVLGVASSWGMGRFSGPIQAQVAQAGEAALAGDWENAETLARQARVRWERYRNFCAALADHEPMEHIDGLFAQLEVYRQIRDGVNFATVCAQLSQDTKAIGEAHSLTWWNLL